ncbi:Ependymin [Liparis tanakae]|uniref:Ependymin n=1 Tax=Liparis tanakae TaxID=230148 RepID=A0A4Z2HBG9_9TELE|nr:Ependymin [Liparis tanakae]
MNFLCVLFCLGLALTGAFAQNPKPCVAPPLMNGGFTLMDARGLFVSTGTVSYDALGQRTRVRNYQLVSNQTSLMDQLMLFNEKVYYEIDWSKLSCKKKALDTTFIPMHVPSDAKLMGQVFMGSSSSWGMGVLVNTWHGELPQNGHYTTVFTEIGCIPLTMSTYSPASGWATVSTFNWVVGNTNPMDYSPPSFCAAAKLEESETPLTFFAALQSLVNPAADGAEFTLRESRTFVISDGFVYSHEEENVRGGEVRTRLGDGGRHSGSFPLRATKR